MSRDKVSRRKVGGRPYKPYTDREMELCLADIDNKILTQREASIKYKIPRSSIIMKLKAIQRNNIKPPGRQCIFTEVEELAFIHHATAMCNFGFPITIYDLRCIVKMYLDKRGTTVKQFKNNLPGRTWAELFLKRHKNVLSQRFCSNIKRVRAAVDEETIQLYFNHLKKELMGVSPRLIFNYDETNLVDDPGKKKILSKRGCKYPEAIKNSTKAAVSIMICGNAAGDILPPYVNYKAEHMWDTWTEGGPDNARYNRSKTGWFDTSTFEDWFFKLLLPVLRKEEGKKAVIGDNLSSHISIEVLKACEEYNIAFVALPPNSTHLTQPLDIAYFRPLKCHWRKVLDEWKSSPAGQKLPTVPKNVFPILLKKLWHKMQANSAENLKAGFKKAGIFPTDETQVLQRLPSFKHLDLAPLDPAIISDSFVQYLEDKRKEVVHQEKGKGRKKKLNIEAGKSISAEEVLQKVSEPSTSKTKCRRKKQPSDSETESDESNILYASDLGELSDEASTKDMQHRNDYVPQPGDYVVVKYEGESWPGQITSIQEDGAYVKCLARCGHSWKWPEIEDCIFYSKNEIEFQIQPPQKMSTKRALYRVPELEDKWGKPNK